MSGRRGLLPAGSPAILIFPRSPLTPAFRGETALTEPLLLLYG